MSKLLVVLGATGTQGGSVVDTFLAEPGWTIRGVTRNASSAAAQKLQARGVEVTTANLDKPASLVAAFKGAYAIFSVTDFWGMYGALAMQGGATPTGEPANVYAGKLEEQQGKNVFDAAAQTEGLQRLVFSSLSNATRWSRGQYTHVYHFDSKARAADYGRAQYPELWKKTSVLQVGFYLNNILLSPFMKPVKDANGVYQITSKIRADVKLPHIATEEDTGPFVKALLAVEPGKNLIAYREWLSLGELTDIMARAQGVNIKAKLLAADAPWEGVPADLVDELNDNMAYFNEFGYEGRDDPSLSHPKDLGVEVKLPSVEEWVKKQDWSALFG